MKTKPAVPPSLVSSLPRWLAWGLVGCTFVIDVLAFAAGVELAPQASLLWILFVPLPTVLATVLLLRPIRRAPRGPVLDVGTTLGHPWVRTERTTAFTTLDEAQRAVGRLQPIHVEPGLDGLEVEIPSAEAAWPEPAWICITAGTAMTVAGLPVGVLGALYDYSVGELGAVEAVTMPLLTPVVLGMVFFVVLLPWVVVLSALQRLSNPPARARVTLRGLVLTCGEERFTLGHPEQRIQLQPGRLVLEQPGARLEIPARADHLVWLSERLHQASEKAGDPSTVPASLSALRAEGELGR